MDTFLNYIIMFLAVMTSRFTKKYPRKFHNLPGRNPQFVGRTISMNSTCSVLGIASFYPAPFPLDTSDSFGPGVWSR